MPSTKPSLRVLFVCTENSRRSQIAEALLGHKGCGAFQVASAGSHPAARVHPMALAILRQQGIEWNGQPKGFESPTYAHWGMPDPASVTDNVAAQRRAFEEGVMYLRQRIDFLVLVPIDKLRDVAVEQRLEAAAQARKAGAAPD